MIFTPRPYQVQAINAGVSFFQTKEQVAPAIEILPTGSGKSVVIANIGKELKGRTVVFQPSKEILEQNYKKISRHCWQPVFYYYTITPAYFNLYYRGNRNRIPGHL